MCEKKKCKTEETSDLVILIHVLLTVILVRTGILVLLVLGDKIVHVGLSLSELHLVHTLTGVPVQERLSAEHHGELLTDSLEHLLDGSGVTDERSGHLESLGRNITHGTLDVVGDPLDEVGRVLVLNVEHLLIDLLGGHASSEHARGSEVTSVTGIGGTHHVLGIKLLLSKFWNSQGTVLLGSTAGQWGETNHEKVKTWEWDQVDCQLAQVSVELAREAEADGHARDDSSKRHPEG